MKSKTIYNIEATRVHVPRFGSGRCCKQVAPHATHKCSTLDALARVSRGLPPFPDCPFHHSVTLGGEARQAASMIMAFRFAARTGHGTKAKAEVLLTDISAAIIRGIQALVSAHLVNAFRSRDGRCVVQVDTSPWTRASRTPRHARSDPNAVAYPVLLAV